MAKKGSKKGGKKTGGGESKWGRVGSAAELYKRIIMAGKSNEAAFEHVKKELGAKAAGKPSYAAWYRRWLKVNGHRPPADK